VDGVNLSGTLTLPGTDGPYPAVLLLSDSGPHDRNGAIAAHRPQAVWADHLARHGIACLRLDDRGVGQSGGSLDSTDLNLLVQDALAAAKALGGHSQIDGSSVHLLGHGEGGVVATHAAQGRDDIAGLVLLNTPGTSGRRVLLDQAEALLVASGAPADRALTHRMAHERALATLPDKGDVRSAFKELISIQLTIAEDHLGAQRPVDMMPVVNGAVSTVTKPLFVSLLDANPSTALADYAGPVLAVGGSLDLQVLSEPNLEALRKALDGHRDAIVLEFPGLNHQLQTARSGTPSEYGMIDQTIDPKLLAAVSDWLNSH
jgi:hypothetical protein